MTENGYGTLRDRILNADDVGHEVVDVPAWGVKLEVRSMTGRERATMIERFIDDSGQMNVKDLYPSLIIACAFDPDSGEQVFSQADHDKLNDKNAAALEVVAQAAMRLSGISSEGQEALGKGSSPAASDGSTST
jgi:hypothetical protein